MARCAQRANHAWLPATVARDPALIKMFEDIARTYEAETIRLRQGAAPEQLPPSTERKVMLLVEDDEVLL
jgi:hypothetical protein